MEHYNFMRNYEIAAKDIYIESLLYPEQNTAKIPGPLPISSTTAALRDNFSITPNSAGKFLLVIDPFSPYITMYTGEDLTGIGGDPQIAGQQRPFPITENIVDQFRVVSCGVILRYYGNFNQMSGIFVGAATTDPAGKVDWTNFNNIEDLTNKYISKCVDGIKIIYTPMDNRATEFVPIKKYTDDQHPLKNQYLFVIYGDLFPNNTCIRVDFYKNIEYTTTPQYREYIMQTKSQPVQFEVPILSSQAWNAPNNNGNFSAYNNNNIPYGIKILEYLNGKGIITNAKMLAEAT